jgi:hypothetical protein
MFTVFYEEKKMAQALMATRLGESQSHRRMHDGSSLFSIFNTKQ